MSPYGADDAGAAAAVAAMADEDAIAEEEAALAAELSALAAADSAAAAEESAEAAEFFLQAPRVRAATALSASTAVTDFFMGFSLEAGAGRPSRSRGRTATLAR